MMDCTSTRAFAHVASLLCITALALPACENPPVAPPTDDVAPVVPGAPAALSPAALGATPNLGAQVAALRDATARFHRIETAVEEGYAVLVRHPETGAACLESEAGGMGRHMLNPALVGDNAVTIQSPEVLIYEPARNGRMRLVGVEYVIPYAIRGADEDPPALFGQQFSQNATFGLWALHVYAWKHNPDGLFAAWNPTITCRHDEG